MLRSLMTAVTGVRAHQTMLDVVGNNVANVNTTGYKKSSTVFQDLLYQTSRGATAPGDARGGVNPLQVGLGVVVAGVEMVNTAGPLQYTGQQTDVAISGNGYFVLRNGEQNLYSRAGNFSLDGDGVLDHVGTGFRVQGYGMEQDPVNSMRYISNGTLDNITLKIGSKIEAKETNVVGYKCNLDSRVGTYLPFGVTNLNANTVVAGTTATADPIPIILENSGAVGGSTEAFTTYTIRNQDTGAVITTFDLEITGINVDSATGEARPVLALVGDGAITGSADTVAYDSDTGVLSIGTSGEARVAKWSFNVISNSTLQSVSLTGQETGADAVPQTTDFLVEFDESNVVSGVMPALMWMKGADGVMSRFQINIPINDDGTFNIDATSGMDITGITGTSGTTTGVLLPAPWNGEANTRRVVFYPAAENRGFEIHAISDAADPSNLTRAATVMQDLTATHAVKNDIYDCKGVAHTFETTFKKVGNNLWRWETYFPNEPDLTTDPNYGYVRFGPCGQLVSPSTVELDVPYSVVGSSDATVTLDFSGESFGFEDVIEGVTQYGSETTTKAWYQDGYAMGVLTEFSVAQDGTINGKYSNGKTIPLYKLALATFDNPMGLDRVGNTAFAESANSGVAQVGEPQVGGLGSTIGGNLEMSNVDIAEEFTRLILAQRGFQANARVVTVSDSILEEAVNLKR